MAPVPLNEALIASNPEAEHYTEAVTVNFDTLAAGANANNSVLEYADTGRLRVSTGTGQSFIQENGSVRSGTNGNDHIIVSLLDGQQFVKSITYHSIGNGAGLINVSDSANHYSSISGSGTLTVNRFGDQISMVVQVGGIVLDSITFEVDRVHGEETLPAPKSAELLILEAQLVQAQADKAAAQAALDDLTSHPVTETVTGNVTSTFSSIAAGNLPDAYPITIPGIGGAKVYRGGNTPIMAMADGSLRTGVNGSHLVVNFDAPAYVSALTLKSWGGLSKYNLGSGYVTFTGTQTINANRVMDSISILVYAGAVAEWKDYTTQITQQVPTAAYTSALQAAQAGVASLTTQIASLIQQCEDQAEADALANVELFIAQNEPEEEEEAEETLNTTDFSSLALTALAQVTTVNLGDLGSTKIEQGGSHALQVVGSGLQAGPDGRDHVVLTFRDGQKFITSVKVTYLGGGGSRLAIGADTGTTRYIDINGGGVINIGQLVRSIAIVSTGNGGARLDELTQDMAQATVAPLTQNWQQTEDTLRRGGSPGYLALGRFAPNAVGIRRDPSQYSVIKLIGTNDRAVATNVRYHTAGGDAALPAEYFDLIDGFVVLHPGAPEQIVIYMGNPDGHDPQGINVNVHHRQSATLEEILPPELMTVRTDILAIRDINSGSEGVGPALTEIADTGRATTPTQGKALLNVWNDGRQGGTVRVVTGYGTPQAHEISLQLGAQQGKSVTINFTVPANGVLSITTIMPDGRMVTDGRTLKTQGETSDRRVATRQPDGTWKLEWKGSDYTGPAVVDNGIVDPGFVAWKQQRMAIDPSVADPANYERAVLAYAEERVVQRTLLIDPGTGGSTDITKLPQAIALYDATHSVPGNLEERVDSHGMIGKIILGTAQKLWLENDGSARTTIANKAAAVTGVDAAHLLAIPRTNIDVFARRVQSAFTQAGFAFLFQGITLAAEQNMVSAADRPVSKGGMVTVRWDLADAGRPLHHVRVYIVDDATGHQYDFSGDLPPAFSYSVPVNPVARANISVMRVKIVAWFADGNGNPIDEGHLTTTTSRLLVEEGPEAGGSFDLSTRAANDPLKAVEDSILTEISKHFPLQGNGWRQTIASDYHLGAHLHAVDLNFGTGNDDQGKAVYAVAKGIVVKNEIDSLGNSTLILKHTTASGVIWFSEYLHIQPIGYQNGDTQLLTPWQEGNEVEAGTQIAEVGKISDDTSMKAHLHFEVHDAQGNLIDIRRLIEARDIATKATDGFSREFAVEWNVEQQQWTATESDAQGLVFVCDGNSSSNGQANVWLAWHPDATKRAAVSLIANNDGNLIWVRMKDGQVERTPAGKSWQWLNGDWQEISLS